MAGRGGGGSAFRTVSPTTALRLLVLLSLLSSVVPFSPPLSTLEDPRSEWRRARACGPSNGAASSTMTLPSRTTHQRVAASLLLPLVLALAPAETPAADKKALPPLQSQRYYDQVADAMPLKTMRGVWRMREARGGDKGCGGTLTFRGQLDQPNRGDVGFVPLKLARDAASAGGDETGGGGSRTCEAVTGGRGKWLMKPSKFEQATIQFNARWKLRTQSGVFVYRGDVSAKPITTKRGVPDATIRGEVLQEGASPDRLTRVGTFEADLISELPQEGGEAGEGGEGAGE